MEDSITIIIMIVVYHISFNKILCNKIYFYSLVHNTYQLLYTYMKNEEIQKYKYVFIFFVMFHLRSSY